MSVSSEDSPPAWASTRNWYLPARSSSGGAASNSRVLDWPTGRKTPVTVSPELRIAVFHPAGFSATRRFTLSSLGPLFCTTRPTATVSPRNTSTPGYSKATVTLPCWAKAESPTSRSSAAPSSFLPVIFLPRIQQTTGKRAARQAGAKRLRKLDLPWGGLYNPRQGGTA